MFIYKILFAVAESKSPNFKPALFESYILTTSTVGEASIPLQFKESTNSSPTFNVPS